MNHTLHLLMSAGLCHQSSIEMRDFEKQDIVRVIVFLSLTLLLVLYNDSRSEQREWRIELSSGPETEASAFESSGMKALKRTSRERHSLRLDKLRKGCEKWRSEMNGMLMAANKTFMHLYVDNQHHLLYCNIPKTGSTTWSYHLASLAGTREVYGVNNSEAVRLRTLAKEKFARLFPMNVNRSDLRELLTVVFVRHPLERLVSAYHSRIRNGFRGQLRATIEAITRRLSRPFPTGPRSGVSFRELVEYMLSVPYYELNRHLAPQFLWCPMCTLDWDLVGHVETFQQDITHLVQLLQLQDVLKVDLKKEMTNSGSHERLRSAFQELNASHVEGLYQLYKIDFHLFGYGHLHKYRKWASTS